jgi:hypothetical protein
VNPERTQQDKQIGCTEAVEHITQKHAIHDRFKLSHMGWIMTRKPRKRVSNGLQDRRTHVNHR